MTVQEDGAQRASISRPARVIGLAIAIALAGALGVANPGPASAAGIKVVVIVGPVGSSTSTYITSAKRYAAQARSYGATVVEIYSPNATWSRVKAAAQGAKVIIYLGHGNGSPSPYGAFSKYTKDGFGLNAAAFRGNSNTKYYGEYYVRTAIKLAPNAVVILNRLCYASGNSEWGRPNPTKTVAKQRVDNFGAGFLRAGARAVFAEGITSASYILSGLFRSTRSMGSIFTSSSNFVGAYDFKFASSRTPGYTAWMAPKSIGRYYRSVVGNLTLNASTFRGS
ncbi:MAG: hypothetical protein ACJ77W_13030 [Chloroflexota bacterium]